jgi:hypothetical protein
MPDSQDRDEQFIVLDLIDDAVIASAYSPLAGTTDESGCGRRPRIAGQQFDSCLQTSSDLRIKLAEPSGSARG